MHSSTQTKSVKTSGKGTIVIISNETKEFNCVLNGGHTTTLSVRPIQRKVGWTMARSNSELGIVAMRKGTSVVEREKDLPTYEDSHQKWTQLCEEQARVAAWELHKHVDRICVTYQENKDTNFKTKTIAGTTSWKRISHEDVYSRLGCSFAYGEQERPYSGRKEETIRKSKESCATITANGTITTTEEAAVYVKNLEVLMTVQFVEDSPAARSQ